MMGKALVDIFIDDEGNLFRQIFDILGTPLVALLIAVIVGMFTLGRGAGDDPRPDHEMPRVVAAAGRRHHPDRRGRRRIQTGSGRHRHRHAARRLGQGRHISVLLLAWVLAVLIRLATGSATVATITASSLMLGLVEGMSTGQVSLVVLAVGAGSLFFSHVNDAGFWLVKQYFGITVGQTIKTWSIMETVLSVTGLVVVLLLGTGHLTRSRATGRSALDHLGAAGEFVVLALLGGAAVDGHRDHDHRDDPAGRR